ncbi:MAG: DUF1273 family protein [Clostridia bacterium]|nr:DUF1273 family protein [Clostridia bacterium]
MIITFLGHSSISSGDKVKETVKEQLQKYITNSVEMICYLGGYGDFDTICARVCRELKAEYEGIELVYVTPYMSLSEQAKIKEKQKYGFFDTSIYPPLEKVPPKFAILKRNEWMITSAELIIAYVNHNYGGAYQSLRFAKSRKKKIINVYDLLYSNDKPRGDQRVWKKKHQDAEE